MSEGKGRPRALLLENVAESAVHTLRAAGFDVDHRRTALREAELLKAVRDVTVLGVRSRTQVTPRVLAAAPRLAAIGAFCIGTDGIDLSTAGQRGIAVVNAPYSNTRSVAELALGEIIALNRRLPERDREMHSGTWTKSATGCLEVRGQTLGIVGYGSIGGQLSVLAEALGMQVLFHDLVERLPLGGARRCRSLHELLRGSDVVSLHVDGRPTNRGLIGRTELQVMQQGSLLLNLCRGPVVDTEALAAALRAGHLRGVAVDVHPHEPASGAERFVSPLQGLPNVILTPHVGGSTEQAQHEIGRVVAEKLRDVVQEARLGDPVALAS